MRPATFTTPFTAIAGVSKTPALAIAWMSEMFCTWAITLDNKEGTQMADHFDSVATDTELHDWIRYQAENGNSFMRTLSEAAMLADIPSYLLLRPVLLQFRQLYPLDSKSMQPYAGQACPRPVHPKSQTLSQR